jgi:molybdenum cofactor biosynthesis protein B
MAHDQHRRSAEWIIARCAVITLSDTRTHGTDTSGRTIREMLALDGHTVAYTEILPDEPAKLDAALQTLLSDPTIDVILTNGGTGISRRDQTIGVIERAIEQPLPGFGELFRMLSWNQIGSAAMLSRAVGGIAKGKLVFAMPGSTKAVELAMKELILPELKHLLGELRK